MKEDSFKLTKKLLAFLMCILIIISEMPLYIMDIKADTIKDELLIDFEKDSVDYVLGTNAAIPTNKLNAKNLKIKSKLTYSLDKSESYGLLIDANKGTITINDYGKLVNAIESNDEKLSINVTANLEAYRASWWNKASSYEAMNASYSLNISLANIEEFNYKLYSYDNENEELTGPNGLNDWYNTEVIVKPNENYEIIRADEMKGNKLEFSDKVVFGEISDNYAKDQGENAKKEIYLRNVTTGEITKKQELDIGKIDTVVPSNLSVSFPEANIKDDIRFYGGEVEIKLSAYDYESGVDYFEWEYKREDGASKTNIESSSGTVSASKDSSDPNKYTAYLTIPSDKAEQLRGNLVIRVVDKAGNKTKNYNDNSAFVIDTINPVPSVTYGLKNGGYEKSLDDTHYFNNDVTFNFNIHEVNFYADDVKISVKKDDGVNESKSLDWKKDSSDEDNNKASLDLTEDGSYKISMSYKDPSGNDMDFYESETVVIDKTRPFMSDVEYTKASNTVGDKNYYNSDLTAKFTIIEKNFNSEDVEIYLKDAKGNKKRLKADWQDISDTEHKAIVNLLVNADHSFDGEYEFEVNYTDLCNNEMLDYKSDKMIIDTVRPELNIEYSNKNVINRIEDNNNKLRDYYNESQKAVITVIEHDFSEDNVFIDITAKDFAGNDLDDDSLYEILEWKHNGDRHELTINYPGDANYSFNIECYDLAGNKAKEYDEYDFTVDTSAPTNLSVSLSTSVLDKVIEGISFGFYKAKPEVTITAIDNISGINGFKYSCLRAEGVSDINSEIIDELIDANIITNSKSGEGVARFELPKGALSENNQFNGYINFTATDRAKNESDAFRDDKRIVVDNIAANAQVQYSAAVKTVDGISYYDGNIRGTVTIHEANFYPEDVEASLIRDGIASPLNISFTDTIADLHIGSFDITGDGDYKVEIRYRDNSSNAMQDYVSEQMTIDTTIEEPTITINGGDADGRAFKENVIPYIYFYDKNYESCEIKLYRSSFETKNEDVTDKFITGHVNYNETGGEGEFNNFDKLKENDGIYNLVLVLRDKAGHRSEKSVTFTVNRFGSVYVYDDYLNELVKEGGAFVKSVDNDLLITEYNPDEIISDSLEIEILRDGALIDDKNIVSVTGINAKNNINNGWYQYNYGISKDNFNQEGVYKIVISSKDKAGNNSENISHNIVFRVDKTTPEITSITGLEKSFVNATKLEVKYNLFDTFALDSVQIYVNGEEIDYIKDFSNDYNNYEGSFVLKESSSPKKVRFVIKDKAGNVTDTDAKDYKSSFEFKREVTVSTNLLVRWFANKVLFYGSIASLIAIVAGVMSFVRISKRN